MFDTIYHKKIHFQIQKQKNPVNLIFYFINLSEMWLFPCSFFPIKFGNFFQWLFHFTVFLLIYLTFSFASFLLRLTFFLLLSFPSKINFCFYCSVFPLRVYSAKIEPINLLLHWLDNYHDFIKLLRISHGGSWRRIN